VQIKHFDLISSNIIFTPFLDARNIGDLRFALPEILYSRRTESGIQKGRRRLQSARLAGRPPLKQP
jgi:hypothetical protein